MQTTIAFTPVAASTLAAPSINLNSIAHAVNVVTDTTPLVSAPTAPIDELKSLEVARISWETTELAASNRRLYTILVQAYHYYLVMKKDGNEEVRKQRATALEQFIAERGYNFTPSSHDMTRVVKCVFGVDRRRVSAYSIALREALRQEIAAADLVEFLDTNGGVEQIRMGGTKPLSATKRAALVKDSVLHNQLANIKMDPLAIGSDADWVDKQVVIIATYLPTGELQANAVVKHDGAVNAALAAYHSNQQAKLRAEAKAEKDSVKAAQAELKTAESNAKAAEAAQKALTAALDKKDKLAIQIAKALAEKEDAEQKLAQTSLALEETVA